MLLILLCSFFLFLYAWLILFYYRAWNAVPVFQPSGTQTKTIISVIVAARNEEQNIPSLLKAMQLQTYPAAFFEVIIVDDYSTDETAALISKAIASNVHYCQPIVSSQNSSKKKAIEAGIALAKGELIITTDADCFPTPCWLEEYNEFYISTRANCIAAPVIYRHDNSLLQVFQALDFLTLQGITAASTGSGFHTMCNGANFGYTRQAFYDVNGFEGIEKVATGDDMLLMYKIYKHNPAKVFYLKSAGVIVATDPMKSWREFFMQRKRWASKTLVYDDYRIIAVLVFVYLLNCLFVFLAIASFFNFSLWLYTGLFLIIKALIETPFVYRVAKFYQEERLMKFHLILQPIHIFYTVIVGFISQSGRYDWKGRRTK